MTVASVTSVANQAVSISLAITKWAYQFQVLQASKRVSLPIGSCYRFEEPSAFHRSGRRHRYQRPPTPTLGFPFSAFMHAHIRWRCCAILCPPLCCSDTMYCDYGFTLCLTLSLWRYMSNQDQPSADWSPRNSHNLNDTPTFSWARRNNIPGNARPDVLQTRKMAGVERAKWQKA